MKKISWKEACDHNLRIFKPWKSRKRRAFELLDRQKAHIFLLKLAGFSYKKIREYYPCYSIRTLKRYIKQARQLYPEAGKFL